MLACTQALGGRPTKSLGMRLEECLHEHIVDSLLGLLITYNSNIREIKCMRNKVFDTRLFD